MTNIELATRRGSRGAGMRRLLDKLRRAWCELFHPTREYSGGSRIGIRYCALCNPPRKRARKVQERGTA